MDEKHLRPMTLFSGALAVLCAFLWGANSIAAKFTQDVLPPIGTAGIRFTISVPFLALWVLLQGSSLWPKRNEWVACVMTGLFVYLQIGTFHYGLEYTNAGHSALIIGIHPAFVALLAHFFLRGESLNRWVLLGLLLSVAGLVLVIGEKKEASPDAVTLFGNLVILSSTLLLSFKIIYSKHVLRTVDPVRMLVWGHLIGAALLVATSGVVEGFGTWRFSWQAVWGLLFMGIVIAVFCFATWTILLRRHPASQLQVFAFGQPFFGVLLGSLFRDDPITLWLIVGAIGIGAGIALVTWSGQRR